MAPRGSDRFPFDDPVAEGRRVAEAASGRQVPLRITGGVAVAIRCPSAKQAPLRRHYADIDLVTCTAAREGVVSLMEELGYTGDREFNMLHGHRRLFFWDEANSRQVDVFVDEARLCHTIDFRHRLEAVPVTLSLADLASIHR